MDKVKFGRTLSISQLDSVDEIISDLNEKSYVFISLHISEEVDDLYISRCIKLCKIIKSHGLKIIADVSSKTKSIFNMSLLEVANLLSLDIIRLDYDVSMDEAKILANKYIIAINASTITEEEIKKYKGFANKIIAIHNYYPHPDTGLDIEYVKKQNELLNNYNIPVSLFVNGSKPYRGPLSEGLPTIEEYRYYSPYVAFVILSKTFKLESIIIGDPNLDIHEEKLINEYLSTGVISIIANINDTALYNKLYTCRIDSPKRLIRVQESREYSCIGTYIKPYNCINRDLGSICIDNANYLRYSGEIMICRENLPKNDKVNVIGNVHSMHIPLLKYIEGNQKFKFIED